jgi:hypothetical protein
VSFSVVSYYIFGTENWLAGLISRDFAFRGGLGFEYIPDGMIRTYQMPTWSTTTATNIDVPATPRRRAPVPRPPLVDDPSLDATIEELDLALGSTADSYQAPPPLMARLAVPRSGGRWTQVLPEESTTSCSPNAISETHLGNLDEELLDHSAEPPSLPVRPPLTAYLPGPTRASVRHSASDWIVSATLILLMFAGAAAGALVFHERLSNIIFPSDARLK